MAQAPVATQANVVTEFKDLSLQLIAEAAAYVAGGVHVPETEANIRQLRILTQALSGALMATNSPGSTVPIIPPSTAPASQTAPANRAR